MCMSVPQIAVLATAMSTSLGPTAGSGMSLSQMPGAASCLTSAFMSLLSAQHAEFASDAFERLQGAGQLLAGECRGHLGADARLTLGHHRVGEADDVHPARQQGIRHAAGE